MRQTIDSATTRRFTAKFVVLLIALFSLLATARADAAPVQLPDLDGAVVGGFSYPKGISIVPGQDGSASALWVSDSDASKLFRISPDGLLSDKTVGPALTGSGSLLHPSGIDFDPAGGTLFVTDTLRNRVLAIGPDGAVTGQQPSPPLADCPMGCSQSSVDGRFRLPSDLAFHDGKLYVVDAGNDRLQQLATGPLAWVSSTAFTEDPEGVTVDHATGDIYVTSDDGVTVISPGGAQRTFGADLELPYGLALDPSRGLLYVADYLADAVVVFDPISGLEVDRIEGVGKPVGVALDPASQILYVTRPESSVIARFDVTPPPTCEMPDDIKAVAGQPVSAAVDCETLSGSISYAIVGQPQHGTISDFDPASGSFVYTPTAGYSGADLVQVQATGTGGPGPVIDVVFDVTTPPAPLVVAAAAEVPVVHKTANLHKVTGTVLVRLPGEKDFKQLTADIIVPLGTLVDATKGRATLTFADAAQKFYDGTFWAGAFQIGQTDGDSPFHEIKLRSEFAPGGVCRKAKKKKSKAKKSALIASSASTHTLAISAKKRKKGKKKGKVWGDGKGSFRTSGSSGSASVRGTRWAVTDYEFGTLFQVSRGEVSVRDNAAHKTVILQAGDSYFAWLSPKSKNFKTSCKV